MDAISQHLRLEDVQALLPGLTSRVIPRPQATVSPGGTVLVITGEPVATWMRLGAYSPRRRLVTASLRRYLRSERARRWRRCLVPATGWYHWVADGQGRKRRVHVRPDGGPVLLAAICRTREVEGLGCVEECIVLADARGPVVVRRPWKWLGSCRSRTRGPVTGTSTATGGVSALRWAGEETPVDGDEADCVSSERWEGTPGERSWLRH